MTADAVTGEHIHFQRKAVQVRLRGGQLLEGQIHIPEGQSLLHFLGTKKYFLNLTSVLPPDHPEGRPPIDHLSVRLSNVIWIVPVEDTLLVFNPSVPTASSRAVELHLVDGLRITVELNIDEEQRMSDYLDANWSWIPLASAGVPFSDQVIERLVVNHEAILAIREIPQS
jgi:hypothetical protein